MKKVYKMIDGMPLHEHLKSGSVENKMTLSSRDYGDIAEVLAKKIIGYSIDNKMLSDLFPGISILSVDNIISKIHNMKRGDHTGDAVFEISYKKDNKYGKKILIFEVKYGVSSISQSQIKKYCSIIDKPGEYFPKADEAKIIYIFFSKINTVKDYALYRTCELDKEFVCKILQSEEQREIKKTNISEKEITIGDKTIELDDDLKQIIDKMPEGTSIRQFFNEIDKWEKDAITKFGTFEQKAISDKLSGRLSI